MVALPAWAGELVTLYESGAYSQFVLTGNVNDRLFLPLPGRGDIRGLERFLLEVLLPRFDIVLSYQIGGGIRVLQGEALFSEWPEAKEGALPIAPRPAAAFLTHFFRYAANLGRLRGGAPQVACLVGDAGLVIPAPSAGADHDLGATAQLIRDWSREEALAPLPLATFLLAENLSDLHPLLVQNPRAAQLEIPLPTAAELEVALEKLALDHPRAVGKLGAKLGKAAGQLCGATLAAVEAAVRIKAHAGESLDRDDLATLKKDLVERDCKGLIEFVPPDRSLSDFIGHEEVVRWLKDDLSLWRRGQLDAMPMGYLLCGPVGTGKTFLAECLAGEAGIPVVKLRNFRDKWVGSTESNLERIFRLLHGLGRCVVFVDEADQSLGSREAGAGDSGLGGRVYAMIADEMSDTRNRGRILWLLASSRPDLIEPDLKRPGRIDVKLPLLPTTSARESFDLIRALSKTRSFDISEDWFRDLAPLLPIELTPGSAEALVGRVYRRVLTQECDPLAGLLDALESYRPPVSPEIIRAQVALALREATDPMLVPAHYRSELP